MPHIAQSTLKSDPNVVYLHYHVNCPPKHARPHALRHLGAKASDWDYKVLCAGSNTVFHSLCDEIKPVAHTPVERRRCGVYRMWHPKTGDEYYGSSKHIHRRIREHKSYCDHGHETKGDYPVYKRMRELGGFSEFNWEVVAECDRSLRRALEQDFISRYNPNLNKIKIT